MRWIVIFFLGFWIQGVEARDLSVLKFSKKESNFIVSLPANPTTGFQWTLKQYDKKLFHLLKEDYVASKPKLIGSGGVTRYVFELYEGKHYPKSTMMTFQYARSWDKRSASIKPMKLYFE